MLAGRLKLVRAAWLQPKLAPWLAAPLVLLGFGLYFAYDHIVAEYHNDVASHSVFHDALTVDGVRTPVNIRHDAFFSGAANDQFTNAFQLDSNSVPLPYSVFLDRMKVTYK